MGDGQDDHAVFEQHVGYGKGKVRQEEATDGRGVMHSGPFGPGIGTLLDDMECPEDSGREGRAQPELLSFIPLGGFGQLRAGFRKEMKRRTGAAYRSR